MSSALKLPSTHPKIKVLLSVVWVFVCFLACDFAVEDITVISVNVVRTVAQKDKKWFVLALLFLLGFFNNIFIFIFESFQPFFIHSLYIKIT